MKNILFLHGFFASGQCELARVLREQLKTEANVISPDLPLHPRKALEAAHTMCDVMQPDLLVGNSCGAFLAQMLAPVVGVPALLGNPHFEMTRFLSARKGEHRYKSARVDGNEQLIIDDALIAEFAELQAEQWRCCNDFYSDKVWGIFGDSDTLAHYREPFEQHYVNSFSFPGGHTPTADEVACYYVPLVRRMLKECPRRGERYFRHFKGGLYRFERSAHDSESLQRKVVYQALYGDKGYWVRSEKMFFERIERDGKVMNRFLEIDKPE